METGLSTCARNLGILGLTALILAFPVIGYGQEAPYAVKREVIKTGETRAIRTMQAVLLAYIVSEKDKRTALFLVDWAKEGFEDYIKNITRKGISSPVMENLLREGAEEHFKYLENVIATLKKP